MFKDYKSLCAVLLLDGLHRVIFSLSFINVSGVIALMLSVFFFISLRAGVVW